MSVTRQSAPSPLQRVGLFAASTRHRAPWLSQLSSEWVEPSLCRTAPRCSPQDSRCSTSGRMTASAGAKKQRSIP
jgi:hypothetical protein